MKAIGIICDACGHNAANVFGPTEFVVASSDLAEPESANPPVVSPPRTCPACGARWDLLHAGDEYLIGLTTVSRTAAASEK